MRSSDSFRVSALLAAALLAICAAQSTAAPVVDPGRTSTRELAPWRTVKDKTGGCRMSVPGEWIPDRLHPFSVHGPNASMALITVMDQQNPLKPLDAAERQMFGIVRTIENTPQRLLYAGKPSVPRDGRPSVVVYTVEVAGHPTCSATINLVPSLEELAKKIAASVEAVR